MDSKLLLTVIMLMATGMTFAMPDDNVETKDDNALTHEEIQKLLSVIEKVDIDNILNNTRLMTNNIKCFLNEGPCSSQMKDIKSE